MIDKEITIEHIVDHLQKKYMFSDVTSGEWVHCTTISGGYSKEIAVEGMQTFLDWDESDETFDLFRNHGGDWALTYPINTGNISDNELNIDWWCPDNLKDFSKFLPTISLKNAKKQSARKVGEVIDDRNDGHKHKLVVK